MKKILSSKYIQKIISVINDIEKKLNLLYSGPHRTKAISATVVIWISAVIFLAFIIRGFLPDEKVQATTSQVNHSDLQTTFCEATPTDATTAGTTTQPSSTPVPETTTVAETTTAPSNDVPTIIPITDLEISDTDLSTDKEVLNKQEANQGPSLSSPLGDISSGSQELSPHIGFTTGIDVSKYQGDINWRKVKKDGISFAFIKVAGRGYESGTLYYDSNYKTNLREASAAGIKVGAYFFSQATTVEEAREEASLMIDALKNYDISYPVVFDWETAPGYRTYSGLSKSTMTAMANTFCDMLEAAGYTAMVYANTFDFERFDASQITTRYASWLARYPENYNYTSVRYRAGDGLPPLDYPYQIWQYSCTGQVNGITGYVDMNVAFIDFANPKDVPMYFDLPTDTYITSIGKNIDILKNVTCYDCAGFNQTGSMNYQIRNSNKKKVSLSTALKTAGEYKIYYKLTDFTGYTGQQSATLYVTNQPSITVKNQQITVSEDCTVEELQNQINANLLSATDGIGRDQTSRVEILYPTHYFEDITITLPEETTSETEHSSGYASETTTLENQSKTSEETTVSENTDEDSSVQEESSAPENPTPVETTSPEETTSLVETITIQKLIVGTYTVKYNFTDEFGGSATISVTLTIEASPSEPSESNASF